ncbi:WXG100 family type VII secretion target [Streptomyces sp. GC420]|uniref:WXG100 family type VII secretion target n=1 Tax=Streptomyces sp. GC420 TaxID=2697568 RepID=UPI0014152051|nr:WXG100 family type VII secretion target [Streptomyces sp. GC420]NBM20493.1 WXG100 family type VII secretion target [Streptomyces sp. GC420]
MANPDQKVTDSALKSLQDELSDKFDRVRAQVQALHQVIDSLEGAWQGIGAGAFNKKQTEINERMSRIGNLLLNYQEAIQAARTISGNTEDEVAAALNGVDVVGGYSGDATAEASVTPSAFSKY